MPMVPVEVGDEQVISTQKRIGDMIRERRDALGWTQERLAAESGVGTRTIRRMEQGEGGQLVTAAALLRAMDLLLEVSER